MTKYRNNHYVPEWYQKGFFLNDNKEKKFFYLDKHPEICNQNGHVYKKNEINRWGSISCFCTKDLYTTKFGNWESTDIEKIYFGNIDNKGKDANNFFSNFSHINFEPNFFLDFLRYLSVQKLRTPKGLKFLGSMINSNDKNKRLFALQQIQDMYCAIWSESIWQIASAEASETKFIISDHPVTVYNRDLSPFHKECKGWRDPDITQNATHTLFPLNKEKILILTNLSWVRNPYSKSKLLRPNPTLFRDAVFNAQQIQVDRLLTDQEVNEINYIIKMRAFRYLASPVKEWLYPEKKLKKLLWNQFGDGMLFMPDPRSVSFSEEIVIGYKRGRSEAYDAYGRKPFNKDYDDKDASKRELNTFLVFKGEFARKFGPGRRGRSYEFGRLSPEQDSPTTHKYHLDLEKMKGKK